MSESNRITGRQLAAALGLARMTQSELAKAANVSVPTLGRMLASEGPIPGYANNVAAIRAALEAAGVVFSDQDGMVCVKLEKGEAGE